MLHKFLSFFILSSLVLISCNNDFEFKFISPQKININKPLSLSVQEVNGQTIDSVHYFLDGKEINAKNNGSLNINQHRLGKHTLTAQIYFEGNTKKLHNTIYFLADKAPTIYNYKLINTYPHDANAFTQGLEFHDGYIYESTGKRGKSSIRKTDLKTGEILQIASLDKKFFGEGMTIFNNKIYQLTWQSKQGFIYNLNTFEQTGSFTYNNSKEGWGLTHNNKELIKSDGTEKIWFLDPETLQEKYFIEAYTNKRKAERLNEIEYINGKIYANIWQKNTIIIINPVNGTIEGVVNLNGLSKLIENSKKSVDYVLNGIAYDPKTERLFVTGKNWDKMFEIELIKK